MAFHENIEKLNSLLLELKNDKGLVEADQLLAIVEVIAREGGKAFEVLYKLQNNNADERPAEIRELCKRVHFLEKKEAEGIVLVKGIKTDGDAEKWLTLLIPDLPRVAGEVEVTDDGVYRINCKNSMAAKRLVQDSNRWPSGVTAEFEKTPHQLEWEKALDAWIADKGDPNLKRRGIEVIDETGMAKARFMSGSGKVVEVMNITDRRGTSPPETEPKSLIFKPGAKSLLNDGWSRTTFRQQMFGNGETQCYKCGGYGHIARVCPNNFGMAPNPYFGRPQGGRFNNAAMRPPMGQTPYYGGYGNFSG